MRSLRNFRVVRVFLNDVNGITNDFLRAAPVRGEKLADLYLKSGCETPIEFAERVIYGDYFWYGLVSAIGEIIIDSFTFAIESARLTILLAGIGPKITFAVAEGIFAGTDEIAEVWNKDPRTFFRMRPSISNQ